MRRTTRPTWPTHKAKRHHPPRRPEEDTAPELTPAELARDLVRRGLASRAILGPQPTFRPRQDTDQ